MTKEYPMQREAKGYLRTIRACAKRGDYLGILEMGEPLVLCFNGAEDDISGKLARKIYRALFELYFPAVVTAQINKIEVLGPWLSYLPTISDLRIAIDDYHTSRRVYPMLSDPIIEAMHDA